MEDKTNTDSQNKGETNSTMFKMVFSSVIGAIIGSVPGALMSLLAKKGGRAEKFSGHAMMTGGMVGMMIGHELIQKKHGTHTQRLDTEKPKDTLERG